jgi:hypothetical protein
MRAVREFTREELEGLAHEQYLRRFPKGKPEPAKFVNVDTVDSMRDTREFWFRMRRYVVPPISYRDGLKLQRLVQIVNDPTWDDADQPQDELIDEYAEVCRVSGEMIWELSRPAGVRRFFKRFMRNPFATAGDHDLGVILGFLSECRTRSSVRLRTPTHQRETSMHSTASTSSNGHTVGNRVRGVITSTGWGT